MPITWTEESRPSVGGLYRKDSTLVEVRAIWDAGVVCDGGRIFSIEVFQNFQHVGHAINEND